MNEDKSWEVELLDDGWYWYNDGNKPEGPYKTEDEAHIMMESYERWFYDSYDID